MVAINTLSLLTVLPALALAGSVPAEGMGHHVARQGGARHRGLAARAVVGQGATHRPRKRGEPVCRPRPEPASEAEAEAEGAPASEEGPASTEITTVAAGPVPAESEHESAPAAESKSWEQPAADQAAPSAEESQSWEQSAESQSWEQPAAHQAPPSEEPQSWEQPAQSQSWEQPAAAAPQVSKQPADDNSQNQLQVSNHFAHSNVGLLFASGPCGDNKPDAANPNGQQWWLNCGIDSNGWAPPFITADQIKHIELSADGVYAKCAPYFDHFYAAGAKHNLPAIVIAAIAMQESTCNPNLTGGAGEVGMMQLLGVNCNGAPGYNCYDVSFNIDKGASYLRERIDANGGSFLLGLGEYNGWHKGMTRGDVQHKANTMGCFAQQNLDYMQQFLNGWLQGIEGWRIGSIFNRKVCG